MAADAGVSVAAVSKVLRDAYGVSEALRLKVTQSIGRLGYRPNVAARGMRGQTFTVGILLVEISNQFLPQVISGIDSVLDPSSYKALIGVGKAHAPLESALVESMIDQRMDGVILIAPLLPGDVLARFARQIPTVVIGHHSPTALEFDTVNGDDWQAAGLVVRSFIERGHRDIAMLSLNSPGATESGVVAQREGGYLAAMATAGLSDTARIVTVLQNPAARDAEMTRILQSPDRPKALFCWSDLDAIHVLGHAKLLGLKVPGDMSVIAIDNSSIAALPLVDLASIDQSGFGQGRHAALALLSRIEGRTTAHHLVLDTHLVVRSSL